MTFSVLFVCRGNVSRSPAAELLFNRAASLRAVASSAGLAALVAEPVDAPTAAVLLGIGLAADQHRARQLSATLVSGADLVLTAEATQRDEVMREVPSAFRRTFTLREFCRAADEARRRDVGLRDPARIVALAARYRGIAGQAAAGSDDVADVYRAPRADAERMVAEVEILTERLVRVLGVARPRPR